MTKTFTTAPLPFQGQKRMFTTEFRKTLDELGVGDRITTVVDLFGGSGLLSHSAKRHRPECRVVYNDYDNYTVRLDSVRVTNQILAHIRDTTAGSPKGQKLDETLKDRILEIVHEYERRGFVDYITLSSSVLFAQNYVLSYDELGRQTLYNKVRKESYDASGYLDGLEVTHMDYKALFAEFRGRSDVLFLVDPPYLSTDTSTYNSDKYWRLRDYLDVLHVLRDSRYVYFTSNKSQIVELLDWLAANYGLKTPFCGATVKTHEVKSHTCHPTYFEKLPALLARINREKRNSKNYVLFLGATDVESNQAPCLSLVQFQIDDGELVMSAYQRSSDANLGLPADIYHLYLMARQIDLPLKSITLNLGNVHIYENNIERTRRLIEGDESVKFELNV